MFTCGKRHRDNGFFFPGLFREHVDHVFFVALSLMELGDHHAPEEMGGSVHLIYVFVIELDHDEADRLIGMTDRFGPGVTRINVGLGDGYDVSVRRMFLFGIERV